MPRAASFRSRGRPATQCGSGRGRTESVYDDRPEMHDTFIPFASPAISSDEIEEVVDTLRSAWITTGPKVGQFERDFASYVGASDAVALSSCTAALHVGLIALGVQPNDVVVTTPMTFSSTIHVIEQVGAKPVLVDVEPDTLNVDPDRVADMLDRCKASVRALLPVHLYGHPADLDGLV